MRLSRNRSLLLLAWPLALLTVPAVQVASRGAEWTNAAQIRQLSLTDAKQGQLVQLRGVVTYCDPLRELLIVEDDTGGVCVRISAKELPLARGLLVSIDGITVPGDFTPAVEKARVRVLEKSILPDARALTVDDLRSGRFDCLRVEVQGTVAEVEAFDNRPALHLHAGPDYFHALLRNAATNDPELERLVDAEVRVRGIARVVARRNGRSRRIELLVPDLDEVLVIRRAPAAPFDLPITRVADLAPGRESHRVKLLARLVAEDGNKGIVVKDDTGQLSVRTSQRGLAQPGDLMEVLGFPIEQRGTMLLDHGVARAVAPALSVRPKLDSAPSSVSGLQLPVLETISEVSHLPPEEAERGYPVRVRGVVTFYDAPRHMLFIRGARNGILIWPDQPKLDLVSGQMVEVDGFSAPGDYMPTIVNARVVRQSQSELPAARLASYETLLAGQADAQWVAFEGIVRDTRVDGAHLILDVAAGGGRCDAFVSDYPSDIPARHLIDAEVRLHGVCSVVPNQRRQAIGFRLFVPNPSQITVKQPAPTDPFALPVRTVESLFRFGTAARPGHRVRVNGIVTMVRAPESFFLRDATGGLQVERFETQPVQPGDQVEVVGFPVIVGHVPHLRNAISQKVGTGPAPAPRPITFKGALTGQFEAELVSLQARLTDMTQIAEQPALVLQSGDDIFEAILPPGASPALAGLLPGSLLGLSGIASTHLDDQGQPRSFRLLVRSPAEIQVLQRPPWWTLRHALVLTAILGLSIFGALTWVGLLRKRVREQTATIQDRLEKEARLESRYRELFENARDIVYTTDLEGRITSFNRAAELTTGYTREEAMGRNLADMIAPGQARQLKPFGPKEGDGLSQPAPELEFIAKDGQRVPVEVDTQLLMEGGRAVGAQGIARNIAERKRAEKAIHEINATLEKRVSERTAELAAANRELEAFSYSVSHDLRAPLRAINGFAEILLKDHGSHLEQKGRRYLQNVAASGRKMGQLVDDLLAFSRLSRHPLTKARLDLNRLVREVAEDLRRQEPEHRVVLDLRPLPPARGDRALVQQVLYNLLSNAWKFTSRNPRPVIEIGSRQDGHETTYYVRDNGAGFEMKYAEKLFGVFQRLHRDDEFPGTGVGLAIVHRILSRHGGRIWAEARLGEGATFYFTLPDDSPKKIS